MVREVPQNERNRKLDFHLLLFRNTKPLGKRQKDSNMLSRCNNYRLSYNLSNILSQIAGKKSFAYSEIKAILCKRKTAGNVPSRSMERETLNKNLLLYSAFLRNLALNMVILQF